MIDVNFRLFCDYLRELEKIAQTPSQSASDDYEYYQEIISSDTVEWVEIRACDEPNPVGFLLIDHGYNCHPDADYFIQETYVKPEYRNQGLMTTAVSKFIQEHGGTYCLFILNNNKNAYQFWHNLFAKLNYKPKDLELFGVLKISKQFGFTPNKEA